MTDCPLTARAPFADGQVSSQKPTNNRLNTSINPPHHDLPASPFFLKNLHRIFEYSDQQDPFRCPSVQSAGYSCSRVLLTGLPCSAICLGEWQRLVCLQAEELMAWVGRCCAARSGVKCLCRTVHAPCSDRTVTVLSPDRLHAPSACIHQKRTTTKQGPFQDCVTVLLLDPARTMHAPCFDLAVIEPSTH